MNCVAENSERTSSELSLWFAYPDDLFDSELAQSWTALLSPDEVTHLHRFRFEKDRRQYLAAHALLRIALSQSTGMAENSLRFKTNEYGKPALDPPGHVQFNLSHCLHLAVCLVSHLGDVGVDVEGFDRAQEIDELGAEVFSASELGSFAKIGRMCQASVATDLWTLKEAYLKALGVGLSIPMDEISLEFQDPQRVQLRVSSAIDPQPDRWRFCLLQPRDHSVAVVAENLNEADVTMWAVRSADKAAARLPRISANWFQAERS
jgi:4'-phosphopantetheinyl transferase